MHASLESLPAARFGMNPSGSRAGSSPAEPATPRLRPVRDSDLDAMRCFVSQGLGPAARRLRFHGGVKPESERLLRHLTQGGGTLRQIAWVAVLPDSETGEAGAGGERIVGEARCVPEAGTGTAEFALAVADAWQGRGLARRLLQALQREAAAAGIERLAGEVLADNGRMAAFLRREGFAPQTGAGTGASDGVMRWTRPVAALRAPVPAGGLRASVLVSAALALVRSDKAPARWIRRLAGLWRSPAPWRRGLAAACA